MACRCSHRGARGDTCQGEKVTTSAGRLAGRRRSTRYSAGVPDEPAIRIMLCDDHELVRRGLSSILEGVGGITVVAEAGDADAALKAVEASRPDVVIMDVRLP